MRKYGFIFLFIIIFSKGYGQTALLYPDWFSGYVFNRFLTNPAFVSDDSKVNLSVQYKFRRGSFRDINSFLAMGNLIVRKNNSYLHSFRIFVQNEREGPYISRPRAYINYSLRIGLGANSYLSAGFNGGFASVNFSAPSGSGNLLKPDAALGLGFTLNKLTLGASVWQLTNSEGVAISGSLTFRRYTQFNGEYIINLSPDWSVVPSFIYQIHSSYSNNFYVSSIFQYKSRFNIGPVYRHSQGLAMAGSLSLHKDASKININCAYNSGFLSNVPSWNDSFELGIRYSILSK